jgi:hypothetical protein
MEVSRDQMGDHIHGNSPRIFSQEQLARDHKMARSHKSKDRTAWLTPKTA